MKFSHFINQSIKEDCDTAWIKFLCWCAHLNNAANKIIILGGFFLWWMTFSAKGFTEITEVDCSLVITAGDAMQFSSTELVVTESCAVITVTLMHTGKLPALGMGHNWVLTREADFRGVVSDGVDAGGSNNFILEGDSRVLAFTKMIDGGGSTAVRFSTKNIKTGEKYIFFYSYPDHWGIMKRTFLLT
ncbi:MAG: azurin [Halieaceae bacterium]|nr:azurin [Halieaceae bacterium]